MKKVIKLILASMLLLCSTNVFAEGVDIVTLTTTAEGGTKDEAVTNALRSIVEQVFGAFVSSNTNIVNDELTRDEIVTVSNGNVRKFDVLSETKLPDGKTFVSVKAEVSAVKLAGFAKNKGVEVEFDGAMFNANVKLQELYASNELKAIENLDKPFHELRWRAYDYKIAANDPVTEGTNHIQHEVLYIPWNKIEREVEYTHHWEGKVYIPEREVHHRKEADRTKWEIPLSITAAANQNFFSAIKLVYNTLQSLSMSKNELKKYNEMNKDVYPFYMAISKKERGMFYLRSRESRDKFAYLLFDLNIHVSLYAEINMGNQTFSISRLPLINPFLSSYRCKLNRSVGSVHDFKFSSPKWEYEFQHRPVIASYIGIKKDKYDLLVFDTVKRGLTTDDIAKIKKITIEPLKKEVK
jgi:hypothetical protein